MLSKKIISYIPFYIIGIISFFVFSPYFTKTTNSDNAVHVLMTESLHFPEDFYYWGQDRLGSLIPMLAHLLFVILPIKSITAISIVQYLTIGLTFFLLQKSVTNWLSKFILCLIIFIPFPLMLAQVYIGHPYVPQFFLFALMLSMQRSLHQKADLTLIRKVFYYSAISIFAMASIWISEVSVFFVFIFILFEIYSSFKNLSSDDGDFRFKFSFNLKSSLTYALLFLIITYYGFKFIHYAKSFCYKQEGIETWFTTSAIFANMLDDFWLNFRDSFEFRIHNLNISIHNLALFLIGISITVITLYQIIKNKKKPPVLSIFFLLIAIISFLFLMFSNWVALNNYGFRYFIYPYLFLVLAIIKYLDTLDGKIRIILQSIYIVGIISYSILTFQIHFEDYKNDTRNFSLKRASLFTPLANSGVIGNYWYSYVLGINSDMNIKATPREGEYIRSPRMVDSVLLKKNIFLIGNQWLTNFPDTVIQYGLSLVKVGSPQKISSVDFCQYKLADLHRSYYPMVPHEYSGTLTHDLSQKSPTPFITDSLKSYPVEFFVYGPFCKLPPGKHKVIFELQFSPTFKQNGGIIFDVSENWGGNVLASKVIEYKDQVLSKEPYTVSLIIDNKIMRSIIEFRMKLSGTFNFQVNKVSIDRIPD